MKFTLTISFLFAISILGQDTLYQINSNAFGFTQQYILLDSGKFNFISECNCTGMTTCGSGIYTSKNNSIKLQFDSTQPNDCSTFIINKTHRILKKKGQYLRSYSYKTEEENLDKPRSIFRRTYKDKYYFELK